MNKSDLEKLYRYAIVLCRDEDMAYDLLQSSVERGLKKGIASMDEPLAYLKITIRNMFFDQQRRNKVVPFISLECGDEKYDEKSSELSLEDFYIQQDEVEQIIQDLSPTESELLYLWAVEEYTADEIAGLQQQPRGTVLSRLHRLKKRIRNTISQPTHKTRQVAQ